MWKKIENLPEEYQDSTKMFVVRAIDILPYQDSPFKYTTDPYIVWRTDGEYHCWPHRFPPTHYCELLFYRPPYGRSISLGLFEVDKETDADDLCELYSKEYGELLYWTEVE